MLLLFSIEVIVQVVSAGVGGRGPRVSASGGGARFEGEWDDLGLWDDGSLWL